MFERTKRYRVLSCEVGKYFGTMSGTTLKELNDDAKDPKHKIDIAKNYHVIAIKSRVPFSKKVYLYYTEEDDIHGHHLMTKLSNLRNVLVRYRDKGKATGDGFVKVRVGMIDK